ncbi:ATP-dependent DNA helicase DinG [Arsenophonus nasoniae]|uniref:ATP-dependent DNA helicase DinG n=1 Tax=Arsenophonus nasoniae TaxID=638 RepID=A0AA95KAZ0_9GAMM|nr:ATP-dependent DNA helicase DinG [Arsenophonus nasoniae]WGM02781.1 ATP-dependent DNA helicase DinG [Arsenophonus nasoniae]
MALTNAIKNQISLWYKSLSTSIDGFMPRIAQRQMIAEVAKTLSGEQGRHLVIEAPTGVGKTLSYLIAGIAISRAENKPLVISTANIALQDQILHKDLPLLAKIIPELRFIAIFGRRRYLCPRNLAAICAVDEQQLDLMYLMQQEMSVTSEQERTACQQLHADFMAGLWDGVRDHYKSALDDRLWQKISTDKVGCLARNCQFYHCCPFFLAIWKIEQVDVIVTNHALVMAAMESGSVLPEAKKMLLVLDEGHHIADVARDSLEVEGNITLTHLTAQLDNFVRHVEYYLSQYRPVKPPKLAKANHLTQHRQKLIDCFHQAMTITQRLLPDKSQDPIYLFKLGQLPTELDICCQQLLQLSQDLVVLTEKIVDHLSEQSGKHDAASLHRSLLISGKMLSYWQNMVKLWRLAGCETLSNAPVSKWLSRHYDKNQLHYYFHCAGIRVSEQLEKLLWQNIPHIIVTSATLRSLESYSRFTELTGLNERDDDRFVSLDASFDHVRQGRLVIPKMSIEPTLQNEILHLAEMAAYFKQQLQSGKHRGILFLFSSQRAMEGFLHHIKELRGQLLVQGDKPRYRLVETHCQRVDQGLTSVLVGLQSFAEGLDLKGDYLSQIHIQKISFPPITNPIIITENEWLKTLKLYPFEVQSLPTASFTLIQQVGRLIRSHNCYGEIIIYDKRLRTKQYGARLLASLPVFPIVEPEISNISTKKVE